MKDSGVKWIGQIPKEWYVSKLKYLFADGDDGLKIGPFGSAIRGKTLEAGSYKIYNQAHLIQNDFKLNRHFVSEETYQQLLSYRIKPGDVLFSMMGTIGKCRIMPEGYPEGIMDSHLLKAGLNRKILPEFFVYAYDKDYSNQVLPQLLYSSNGTIMNGLNSTILKSVMIAIPPIEEQRKIVDYLDSKCSKIDAIIACQEEIIEKLKEYKSSIIIESVTRGLNPNVKMKDSGVEWIGEVPADWKIISVKYLCSMESGNSLSSEYIKDFGDYSVYGGNGQRGFYKEYNTDGEFVLVGRQGALCGNVHLVSGKIWATEHAVVTRNLEEVDLLYLYYLLIGMNLNQYVSSTAAQPGLAVGTLKNIKTVWPPLEEQRRISDYLDKRNKIINKTINQKKVILNKLREYKKSLIYEVVTGKKEV